MAYTGLDQTLFKIDASQNMHRYYTVTVQPNLFGGHSVLRIWGRIGSAGQTRIDFFDSVETAAEASDRLINTKRKRGYSTQT